MLWKFNSVYDPRLQLADHGRPVRYEIPLPPAPQTAVKPRLLYLHSNQGRRGRTLDHATEEFVDESRMGAGI
jgi:hypothetical protein